ncbi:transposase [Streptomyces ambofaciens]
MEDRQVINGIVYKIRTGVSWRDLPERYGPWKTVYTRFPRYALVEHGIAHLKNWRALARHLGRREHMSDTIQAVAGLLSRQQAADLKPTRQT